MLDILFENRNKQYGAYALRKFYANRMGVALAISLSSVLLLLFLFSLPSNSSSTNAALPDDKTIIVSTVDIPKEELPPPAKVVPPVAQPKAQVAYNNNIIVVPDNLADEPLPTVDDIQSAVISNITTAGTPDDGIPAATSSVSDGQAAAPPAPDDAPPIFDPIEKQPEYPGGVEAWRNFLSRYLQAPDELAAGERKTVQVRFMVSATGEVTNFEIVQSAGVGFDREVLRVMKKMPKWAPAIQNGHKIAVSFVQPVTFQGIEE